MLKKALQRGDTLIEVLFAVSVFSFVVVGSLAIMNQGTAASQRALEITLVRQQIDAQAEALRFMHDSYVAVYQPGISYDLTDDTQSPAEEWYEMIQRVTATGQTDASSFAVTTTCPAAPSGSFIVDPKNALFVTSADVMELAVTYPQVRYDSNGIVSASQGLWIEGIRSRQSDDADQSNTGFIDFHIRACWDGAGLPVPMTTGTIVRLYEPRT